jgi:hypothetical protein
VRAFGCFGLRVMFGIGFWIVHKILTIVELLITVTVPCLSLVCPINVLSLGDEYCHPVGDGFLFPLYWGASPMSENLCMSLG